MLNPVRGTRGIAAAPHALASQSALAVMREGGNAIEAMIAAAATIAVVYPHMNSIGGDAFWLIRVPGQPMRGIDACGAAAGLASRDWYREQSIVKSIPFRGGLAANTVAGTISGWDAAFRFSQDSGGRLPLTRLLADAIDYARQGAPVTRSQHLNTAGKRDELHDVPGFSGLFMPDGNTPEIGSRFMQPALAASLERMAQVGLDDFYRGELARTNAAALERAGSPVRLPDLQAHHATWRDPLWLAHSLGRVYNMPPPTQGAVSLMILGILDRLPLASMDPLGADFVHAAVEATKQAFRIRDRHITDPAYMTVDPASFLQVESLEAMRNAIDPERAAPWGQGKGPADTIWMGTVDRNGIAVSFIQSLYHEFGSGVVLDGSGVTWQNRGCSFSLDPEALNTLEPGRKPFHTLNPAMAELSDGRVLVYGNMGGDGQPQSQSAVFSRIANFGMDPQAAISAPRWLLGRTWGRPSDSLKLESRFSDQVVKTLRQRGHELEVMGDFDEAMGHAQAIVLHPNGILEGGADPRGDGVVAAF
ncbi:MAG: gamma-glutamyltransferase family protein [Quisquiliibacterium sp.]